MLQGYSSSGQVQLLDGQLYFSPNSSRVVKLPPSSPLHPSNATGGGNVLHIKDVQAVMYHQPQWWTKTYGWMSFVPCNPSYTGSLFERLSRIPASLEFYKEGIIDIGPRTGGQDATASKTVDRTLPATRFKATGYALPGDIQESWARLEYWMTSATSILMKTYEVAAIRPLSTWSLGYHRGFRSHAYAVAQAYRSRDWFSIWMGLLSYSIALAEKAFPVEEHWALILQRSYFSTTMVDSLRYSTVCDFSAHTLRAGIFVDVMQPRDGQPDVDFFLSHHVPVWYRWGPLEANNAALSHLSPQSFQMQAATTMITKTPELIATSEAAVPSAATGRADGNAGIPSYQSFFEAREKRNAKRLLTETALDRQRRLNRERNPPTVSAKVFEWVSRGFGEPKVWDRLPVLKSEREETLMRYSAAQRRYDSFNNEWDCCDAFGPDDDEDEGGYVAEREGSELDAASSWIDPPLDSPFDAAPPAPRVLTPPPRPAQDDDAAPFDLPRTHPGQNFGCSAIATTSPSPADALQEEVLQILALHYGYTPPLPLPCSCQPLGTETERKKLVRFLGLSWDECAPHVSTTPVFGLAKAYLDKIKAGVQPESCDLNAANRLPVAHLPRFKRIRLLESLEDTPKPVYAFDFGVHSEAPWKLATSSAADALMISRLDSRMGEYEIATYLLQQGVSFHTLIQSELAPKAPQENFPPCVLPIRSNDAKFTQSDYDSYARERLILLRQRRTRAALMRGGFVWRICVPIVSFQTVLQGPAGWNTDPGAMFVARDPEAGTVFFDDNMTDVELNSIAGTYVCPTGFGSQTATRSWFPIVSTFEAGGEDYRRWNSYREEEYMRRLDEINNPQQTDTSRGPLAAKKWRDLMRGMKEMRKVKDVMEDWSSTYIQQNV